jgi:hypothetical protein
VSGNGISSGNSVYDQVVRERQSLQQSVTHGGFRAAGQTETDSCCGQGRASLRSRDAGR